MNLIDYLILGLIVLVLGIALFAVIKAKKSGKKCMGCAYSKTCHKGCGSCSGNCGDGCE